MGPFRLKGLAARSSILPVVQRGELLRAVWGYLDSEIRP
jgi:hypothetical protein